MSPSPPDRPRAVLVAVQLPDVDDLAHAGDLIELRRLVETLGFAVVSTISQRRDALAASAVLGEGKLRELARLTGGPGYVPSPAPEKKDKARARRQAAEAAEAGGPPPDPDEDPDALPPDQRATVVVVDHELTPSQARNLERATGAEVLDRTGVIVEIFHRHARSREARMQVEIARLLYVSPRLRETGAGKDKQRGGNVKRGAGESALELDRRKIRDRIAELREEIAAIQREQGTRRAARKGERRVALVGYTNAGKSSLFRALTGSDVLVADKLFATLDTTVRALHPDTRPRILVSDTVGFIKKLPHDLVASFRSTLDEALEASLLLYVTDAADPTFRAQLEVTRDVLAEIGAGDVPSLLLLNKVDRLAPADRAQLRREHPDAILLSALDKRDIVALREQIVTFFEGEMIETELVVPWTRQALVHELHETARVLGEEHDESGTRVRVRADAATIARFERALR